MFKTDKLEKHKLEFIQYYGHLPYLITAMLSMEEIKQRNEYLKECLLYDIETKALKHERRQDQRKLSALKEFLLKNPQFRDIVNYDKLMLL